METVGLRATQAIALFNMDRAPTADERQAIFSHLSENEVKVIRSEKARVNRAFKKAQRLRDKRAIEDASEEYRL